MPPKPNGESVQVISLEGLKVGDQTSRALKLHTQVLKSITSAAEDYQLAVIVIAGPARCGKSFILSYVIRYLRALERAGATGAGDWMEKDDPKKSMQGKGFKFQNGTERTTDGIWMWSRPFIVKTSVKSEPIAVLVVDTEGCFDSYSNEKEQSALVGLGLLLSSCFIFNESTKINENTFMTMAKFMQYGQIATQSFGEKGFQRLMFLVRDWNMPGSHEFGAAGGQAYLKKIMTPNVRMSKEAVECRELIAGNFEDYDAYLMPHPGEDVISDDFQGSVAEMNDAFRTHVELFITHLIEDVAPKTIASTQSVTGNGFYGLVCNFVDAFNADDMPSPVSILKATMMIAFEAEANTQVNNYRQRMDAKLSNDTSSLSFVDQKKLDRLHLEVKKKVLTGMRVRFGTPEEQQALLEKISQNIETRYRVACEVNQKALNEFIDSRAQDIIQYFQTRLNQKIASVPTMSGHEEFQEAVGKLEKKAESAFIKCCQDTPEDFTQKQWRLLKDQLQTITKKCWEDIKAQIDFAEAALNSSIEESVSLYSDTLSSFLDGQMITASILQRLHTKYSTTAIQNFKRKVEAGDFPRPLLEISQQRLGSLLEEQFQILSKESSDRVDELIQQFEKDMDDAAELLQEELQELLPTLQASDLSLLDDKLNEILDLTTEQDSYNDLQMLDSKLFNKYRTQLVENLKSVVEEAKRAFEQSLLIRRERSRSIVQQSLSSLKAQILSLHAFQQTSSQNEFLPKLQKIQATVEASLEASIRAEVPDELEAARIQFHELAENEKRWALAQDQERLQKFENDAENALDQCKERYEDELNGRNNWDSVAALDQAHSTVSSRVFSSLRQLLHDLSKSAATRPFEERLQADLNRIYESQKSALERQLQVKRQLIDDAIPSAVESFESQGKSIILKNPFIAARGLKKKLDSIADKVKSEFEEQIRSTLMPNSKEYRTTTSKLETDIDEAIETLQTFRRKSLREAEERIETLKEDCVQSVRAAIEKVGTSEVGSGEPVAQVRVELDDAKGMARGVFDSLWKFEDEERKDSTWSSILETIEPMTKKAFQAFVNRLDEDKKGLLLLSDDIIRDVGKSLSDTQLTGKFFRADNLEQKLETIKTDSKASFLNKLQEKRISQSSSDITDQFMTKVESRVEAWRRKNQENIQDAETEAKRKCESYLESKMAGLGNNKALEEATKEALSAAQEFLQYKCADGISEHKDMTEKLQQFGDALKQRAELEKASSQVEAEVLENAVLDYNTYRTKCMMKKKKLDGKQLAELHKLAVEMAIKECSKQFYMTPALEKAIQVRLIGSLKVYDIKAGMSQKQTSDIAVGIDLGTTTCCVAFHSENRTKVIKNELGKSLTPSYVFFPGDGKTHVVGAAAQKRGQQNPEHTVFDAKRLIGRKFSDPHIQNDIKNWPFKVQEGAGEKPEIVVHGKKYSPEDISAILLSKIREIVSKDLRQDVKKAVITVPANFDDRQRDATKQAAAIAGFEVLQIINEPTAAALAYAEDWKDTEKNVLVYDFGGGTFDVTILHAAGGDLRVLTTVGDTHLGGEDCDNKMMDFCGEKFKAQHGVDVFEVDPSSSTQDERSVFRRKFRLRQQCEDVKQHLTSTERATVNIPAFYGETDLMVEVTRDDFESLNEALFQKTIEIVGKALKDAKLKKEDVDEVLMIGGSSRIPKVQQLLQTYLGSSKRIFNQDVDIQEAVARGAAIQACILNGGTTAFNLIRDVQPFSLGIATVGEVMSVIIKKDAPIPTEKKQPYTTVLNNQKEVYIEIFSGEDPKSTNNKPLGEFTLGGIPPGPAGSQRLEVSMKIDSSGILEVTAVCLSNNVKQNLVIQDNRGRLTEEEIEKRREELLELPPPFMEKVKSFLSFD